MNFKDADDNAWRNMVPQISETFEFASHLSLSANLYLYPKIEIGIILGDDTLKAVDLSLHLFLPSHALDCWIWSQG